MVRQWALYTHESRVYRPHLVRRGGGRFFFRFWFSAFRRCYFFYYGARADTRNTYTTVCIVRARIKIPIGKKSFRSLYRPT